MMYIGMTLLLGFAAVNTGNNLLYLLLSALLGFMAVSGWLGQQNLRRLSLSLVLPQEIYANQPTLVGIKLHNQRRQLPAFLIGVEMGGQKPLFIQVPAAADEESSLMFNWPERGIHQIDGLWLRSSFPINFFIRSLKIPINQKVLVFPQPLKGSPPPANGYSPQRQQLANSSNGDSGDLRSIHDYRGREPLKAIHWKLSARHDVFKVKQHEGLGAQPIVIEFDQFQGNLEKRLGRACGLIIDQLRNQRPVGLRLAGRLIAPQAGNRQRRRLLTKLALYDGR